MCEYDYACKYFVTLWGYQGVFRVDPFSIKRLRPSENDDFYTEVFIEIAGKLEIEEIQETLDSVEEKVVKAISERNERLVDGQIMSFGDGYG